MAFSACPWPFVLCLVVGFLAGWTERIVYSFCSDDSMEDNPDRSGDPLPSMPA